MTDAAMEVVVFEVDADAIAIGAVSGAGAAPHLTASSSGAGISTRAAMEGIFLEVGASAIARGGGFGGAGCDAETCCAKLACCTGIATCATMRGVVGGIDASALTREPPIAAATDAFFAGLIGGTRCSTSAAMGGGLGSIDAAARAGRGGIRRALGETSAVCANLIRRARATTSAAMTGIEPWIDADAIAQDLFALAGRDTDAAQAAGLWMTSVVAIAAMFVVGGHIDAASAAIAFSDGAGEAADAFATKGGASASLVAFAAMGEIAFCINAAFAASGEIGQTEALPFGALFSLWTGLGIAAFGGRCIRAARDKEPEQRPREEPTKAVFSREAEGRGGGKRGREERKRDHGYHPICYFRDYLHERG